VSCVRECNRCVYVSVCSVVCPCRLICAAAAAAAGMNEPVSFRRWLLIFLLWPIAAFLVRLICPIAVARICLVPSVRSTVRVGASLHALPVRLVCSSVARPLRRPHHTVTCFTRSIDSSSRFGRRRCVRTGPAMEELADLVIVFEFVRTFPFRSCFFSVVGPGAPASRSGSFHFSSPHIPILCSSVSVVRGWCRPARPCCCSPDPN